MGDHVQRKKLDFETQNEHILKEFKYLNDA